MTIPKFIRHMAQTCMYSKFTITYSFSNTWTGQQLDTNVCEEAHACTLAFTTHTLMQNR